MRKTCICTIALCLLVAGMAYAQNTAWVARYNGLGNGADYGKAIAVDATGNVYVTGYAAGSGTANDYVTIKYKPDGDTAWVRRYNGPPGTGADVASAVALDRSGNVYVTGYSMDANYDYATVKYNSAGDTVWVRRYNGPGNSTDEATAITVDADGNVYVTGLSASGAGGTAMYDYGTVKYNSAGETLWVARYNGPGNGADQASKVALDAAGNVYVTGYSKGVSTGTYDYATVKYNSAGETLWVRRYDGPGNTADQALALALDAAGNPAFNVEVQQSGRQPLTVF